MAGQLHFSEEDEQELVPAPSKAVTLNAPQAVELPEDFLQGDPAECDTVTTDQMNLMALFMQDYMGNVVKAMRSKIVGMLDSHHSGMQELSASACKNMQELSASIAGQNDKIVDELGSRMEEKIALKLAEHKFQDVLTRSAETLTPTGTLNKHVAELLATKQASGGAQPAAASAAAPHPDV